ncbi:hypothetical protein DFH28DRAFT_1123647 [Melampsora americana]|nr:hypothetical protein DFH28DRAFT_1123647 [Melampsora americana]
MSNPSQDYPYGPGLELDNNGDIKVPDFTDLAPLKPHVSVTQTLPIDPNIDPVLFTSAYTLTSPAPSGPSLFGGNSLTTKLNLVHCTQKRP